MKWLVDGYNLLLASQVFPRQGRGELHFARLALLDHLAQLLPPEQRPLTTIVFDAKDAPPQLPARLSHHDIDVRFARDHSEADDLIEHLIQLSPTPRQLTVVSNDRRLHRAARRRRCRWTICQTWLQTLAQHAASSRTNQLPARQPLDQPPTRESSHEVMFSEEYLEELRRLERDLGGK